MTYIVKAFILLSFFLLGMTFVNAGFEDDAMAYVRQDFPGQDIRLVWDYPDRVAKLPLGVKITSYKNIGQNRVQFNLEGQEQTIAAQIDSWVEVPTLRAPMAKGSIIREDDIVMQKSSLTSLKPDVVLKKEELIGKAPKAHIQPAMQAIKSSDLISPVVVKRDAVVTIIYRTPSITLTTKAKALKDGAVGDKITFEVVKPKNQKKHIEAVIVDQDTAEVKVTQVA